MNQHNVFQNSVLSKTVCWSHITISSCRQLSQKYAHRWSRRHNAHGAATRYTPCPHDVALCRSPINSIINSNNVHSRAGGARIITLSTIVYTSTARGSHTGRPTFMRAVHQELVGGRTESHRSPAEQSLPAGTHDCTVSATRNAHRRVDVDTACRHQT